jgi:hypothetical protein
VTGLCKDTATRIAKACYGREASLPKDKVYTGGAAGASLMQAMQFAAMQGKKNVAIARASAVDGHAFAFDGTPDPSGEVEFDDGCDMPCADSESLSCGCGDEVCAGAGAQPLPGENNARRWVVYEVPPEVAMLMEQQQRKSRKGSKGGKSKGGKGGGKGKSKGEPAKGGDKKAPAAAAPAKGKAAAPAKKKK